MKSITKRIGCLVLVALMGVLLCGNIAMAQTDQDYNNQPPPEYQTSTAESQVAITGYGMFIAKSPEIQPTPVTPPKTGDANNNTALYSVLALLCITIVLVIVELQTDKESV